jgi:hypothetical protein
MKPPFQGWCLPFQGWCLPATLQNPPDGSAKYDFEDILSKLTIILWHPFDAPLISSCTPSALEDLVDMLPTVLVRRLKILELLA